eukprot:4611113-Prymnesium_polylepis.2
MSGRARLAAGPRQVGLEVLGGARLARARGGVEDGAVAARQARGGAWCRLVITRRAWLTGLSGWIRLIIVDGTRLARARGVIENRAAWTRRAQTGPRQVGLKRLSGARLACARGSVEDGAVAARQARGGTWCRLVITRRARQAHTLPSKRLKRIAWAWLAGLQACDGDEPSPLAGMKPARQPQLPPSSGTRSPGHVALPPSSPVASFSKCSSTVNAPWVGTTSRMSYTPPPAYSTRAME